MGVDTLANMRTKLWYLLDTADEVDPSTPAGQSRADGFLNWSYQRVQLPSTFEHVETQTTQAITVVTSDFDYTLTLRAIDHVVYQLGQTDFKILNPRSRDQMSRMVRASGPPDNWARWGTTLYLNNTPTATENGKTITVFGWANPVALATSSAASILTVEWDEVIVVGAAWRGWRSLGDQARADVYREEYGALVNDNKAVMSLEGHVRGWVTSVASGQHDYYRS